MEAAAIAEALTTLRAQTQNLEQAVGHITRDIAQLRADTQQEIGRIRNDTRARGGIDIRGLTRRRAFTSSRSEWSDWAFAFKAYMGAASAQNIELFRLAEEAAGEIDDLTVEGLGAESAQLSTQLYLMLSLHVTGEALQKIKNVVGHNGVECWRILTDYYDPRARGRHHPDAPLAVPTSCERRGASP